MAVIYTKRKHHPAKVTVFSESYWAVLAGARFCLAAIVFAVHLPWFTNVSSGLSYLAQFGGFAAVLGFLVISGVSIGHSYTQQPDGYFQRRFLRIYPLYFISVCFALLLTYTIGSGHYVTPEQTWFAAHWKTNFGNLFFLQGFTSIAITYNEPLWTISIEVFFYILVPFLMRLRPFALVGLVLASMLLWIFSHKGWLFGYSAARYAWPWLIGFVFATRSNSTIVAFLALIGTVTVFVNKVDTGEHFAWLTFAMVVLLIFLARYVRLSIKVRSILNFFGEMSYPLYLFHWPLCLALARYFGIQSPWWLLAITFIAVVAIDYVFDHWLKTLFWKPMLKWVIHRKDLVFRPKPPNTAILLKMAD
jgi:peptidoglycan/LPS O-acetylase OafA/YrhL